MKQMDGEEDSVLTWEICERRSHLRNLAREDRLNAQKSAEVVVLKQLDSAAEGLNSIFGTRGRYKHVKRGWKKCWSRYCHEKIFYKH
jgi:hypothetical protein